MIGRDQGFRPCATNPNSLVRTSTDVKPAKGDPDAVQWNPILIQGVDRFGHFQLDPAPFVNQHRI